LSSNISWGREGAWIMTMSKVLLKLKGQKLIGLIIWKYMELSQNVVKSFAESAVLLHKFC
jgi:hypothetical protein